MDYLVAPISADRVVMESTLNYAVVVKSNAGKTYKEAIAAYDQIMKDKKKGPALLKLQHFFKLSLCQKLFLF